MDWQDAISLLIQNVPGVVIMLTGVFLLLATSKFWGDRIFFRHVQAIRALGWILVPTGFIMLIATTWSETQEFWDVVSVLLRTYFTSLIWIFLGLSVVACLVLLIRGAIRLYDERGFAIVATPTTEYGEAMIRVDNIGRGLPTCVAQITRLVRERGWRERRREISLDEVNPHNQLLTWTNDKQQVRITTVNPPSIRLFDFDEGIPPMARIVASGHTWGEFSLENGYFRVSVRVSKLLRGRAVPMVTVEDRLVVADERFNWEGGRWRKTTMH